MDIFKNLEPNGEYEKNNKMIDDLRAQIHKSLIEMRFEIEEQHDVLKIIDEAREQIREISKSLVGSNINNNPKKATEKAMKEITKIINELPKKIKKQMEYIVRMKKDLGEY